MTVKSMGRRAFLEAVIDRNRTENPDDEGLEHGVRFAENVVKGTGTALAGIPEGVGILAKGAGEQLTQLAERSRMLAFLDPVGKMTKEAGELARSAAEATRQLTDLDILPGKGNFLTEDVAQGVGSTLPLIATGGAAAAAGAGKVAMTALVATQGALMNGAAEFMDAELSGSPEDEKWTSFLLGAAAGTSEALPIGNMARRLGGIDKRSGGMLKRLMEVALEGGEEAIQEVFQTASSNLIADHVRGEDRKVFEGALKAGTAGGAVGLLLSMLIPGKQAGPRPEGPIELDGQRQLESGQRVIENPDLPTLAESQVETAEPERLPAALQPMARLLKEAEAQGAAKPKVPSNEQIARAQKLELELFRADKAGDKKAIAKAEEGMAALREELGIPHPEPKPTAPETEAGKFPTIEQGIDAPIEEGELPPPTPEEEAAVAAALQEETPTPKKVEPTAPPLLEKPDERGRGKAVARIREIDSEMARLETLRRKAKLPATKEKHKKAQQKLHAERGVLTQSLEGKPNAELGAAEEQVTPAPVEKPARPTAPKKTKSKAAPATEHKRITNKERIVPEQKGESERLKREGTGLRSTIEAATKRIGRTKRGSNLNRELTNTLTDANARMKPILARLEEIQFDDKLRRLSKAEDAIEAGIASGDPEHVTIARISRLAGEHLGAFPRGTPTHHNIMASEERALMRLREMVGEMGLDEDMARRVAGDVPGFYTLGESSFGAVTSRLGGASRGGVPNAAKVPLADFVQAWKDTIGIHEASKRMEDAARRLKNQNLPGSDGPYGGFKQEEPWKHLVSIREVGPDGDPAKVVAAIDAKTAELEEMIKAGGKRLKKAKAAKARESLEKDLEPIRRLRERTPWADWLAQTKKGVFLSDHFAGNMAGADSPFITDGRMILLRSALQKRTKFFEKEQGGRYSTSTNPLEDKAIQSIWDGTGGSKAEVLGVLETDVSHLALVHTGSNGGAANAFYLRNIFQATGADEIRIPDTGKKEGGPWSVYRDGEKVAVLMPVVTDDNHPVEAVLGAKRKLGDSIDSTIDSLEAEIRNKADVDDGDTGGTVLGDPGTNELLDEWGDAPQPMSGVVGPEEVPAAASPLKAPRDPVLGGGADLNTPVGGRLLGRLRTPPEPVKGGLVSQPQIIHALSKVMRAAGGLTPIRVGRMGAAGRSARGFFKVTPEIIRIKVANNVATAAHEVGHALEKHIYGWKQNPWKNPRIAGPMQRELAAMGKALYGDRKPAAGYKREGFAEYIRLYVTTPAVLDARAPKFHAWFQGEFLKAHPKVGVELANSRDLIERWGAQGSQNRAEASIVHPTSTKERTKRNLAAVRRAFSREALIEMAEPLREYAKVAEKGLGRPLRASEDPFVTTSALRTTHSAITKYMVERGMRDLAGNVTGPALNEISALVKGRQRDFTIYLWAKRAVAIATDPLRAARNAGLSLEDASTILEELDSPKFQLASDKVYAWNDGVLAYAAQASPTFAKVVERVREVDPGFYIPLQREFLELDSIWAAEPKGSGGIVQRLKGSGRRIRDPFPQMISQAEHTVLVAHRRLVLDQIIKLSELDGMGYLVEKVPHDQVPVASRTFMELMEEINKKAMQATGDILDWTEGSEGFDKADFMGETLTFFAPAAQPKGVDANQILPVWNGKSTDWYQVDPRLMRVLGSLDVYRLPQWAELIFGIPTKIMRAGTTGLRASFGLVTNPLRDVRTFVVNSRSNENVPTLLAHWFKHWALGGIHHATGGKITSPWMDAWMRLGGEMSQPFGQDIEHTGRAARRLFQGRAARVFDPRNAFDFLRDILQFPEGAGRIAELKLVAKQIGWEPGQPMTLDQSLQMLLASKQVTTDFTAAGEFARTWNRIAPFHNAAIQGPRAHIRAAMRDPGRFALRAVTSMTIPALVLWWLNKDEEWYKELSPEEMFMNDWISTTIDGREELIQIPRPFEMGAVFSALPEVLLDSWYRQDPDRASKWFGHFIEITAPNMEPVLLDEALDQYSNRDRFWDTPIVPMGQERKPPEEQFSEYTTRASRFMGDLFGWSPRRIDHFIKGVAGGTGMDILEAVGLGGAGTDGREEEPSDTLVIGKLFRRGGRMGYHPRSIDKLYEKLQEAQTLQASDRHEETPEERQTRLMLTDVTKALSALSFVRGQAKGVDERRAIMQEATSLAQEALADIEAGEAPRVKYQGIRKRAEARERSAER